VPEASKVRSNSKWPVKFDTLMSISALKAPSIKPAGSLKNFAAAVKGFLNSESSNVTPFDTATPEPVVKQVPQLAVIVVVTLPSDVDLICTCQVPVYIMEGMNLHRKNVTRTDRAGEVEGTDRLRGTSNLEIGEMACISHFLDSDVFRAGHSEDSIVRINHHGAN
jgi:hypothetical protein